MSAIVLHLATLSGLQWLLIITIWALVVFVGAVAWVRIRTAIRIRRYQRDLAEFDPPAVVGRTAAFQAARGASAAGQRRLCPRCGAMWFINSMPPRICSQCGYEMNPDPLRPNTRHRYCDSASVARLSETESQNQSASENRFTSEPDSGCPDLKLAGGCYGVGEDAR